MTNRNFSTLCAVICTLAIISSTPSQASESKAQYDDLVETIHHHNKRYYQNYDPEISDQEYDLLFNQLKTLEIKHPEWVSSDSPSQTVGNNLNHQQKTFPHLTPMLSIENVNDARGVFHFDQAVTEKLKSSTDYWVEEKIDGIALSLHYENQKLKYLSTRGDGYSGNIVFASADDIFGIPHTLPEDVPSKIEIRGEIYMEKSDFEKINAKQKSKNKKPFANPRNITAGSIRLNDVKEIRERNLKFIAFGMDSQSILMTKTQKELEELLQKWGFQTPRFGKYFSKIKDVLEHISWIEHHRGELSYEIDGAVIKVNHLEDQIKLGNTVRDSGGMLAYKYPDKTVETELIGVKWQLGKRGLVTPVAILKPVWLDGSNVSRASLHNWRKIEKMDLHEKDIVTIEKRGRIIPIVTKTSRKATDAKPISKPIECPECKLRLSEKNGQLFCPGCSSKAN